MAKNRTAKAEYEPERDSLMLAQVKAPHFTAGIVLADDVVTEAAPIVKYMIGWHRNYVRHYCQQKRWEISVVKEASRYR